MILIAGIVNYSTIHMLRRFYLMRIRSFPIVKLCVPFKTLQCSQSMLLKIRNLYFRILVEWRSASFCGEFSHLQFVYFPGISLILLVSASHCSFWKDESITLVIKYGTLLRSVVFWIIPYAKSNFIDFVGDFIFLVYTVVLWCFLPCLSRFFYLVWRFDSLFSCAPDPS